MELKDLYKQIINPIDDPKVMNKLLNAYAQSTTGKGDYYDHLVSTVDKNGIVNRVLESDKDTFYALMFNKWKNSILLLTKDDIQRLINMKVCRPDFFKLQKFLEKVPNVKTKKEADNIFFRKRFDKELQNALNYYRWTAFGENTSFCHVCSSFFTTDRTFYPDIKHRLYVDTNSLDVYKFVTIFVQTCDRYHLPYYFKFDEMANRDDSFVVYSSDENLLKYLEVLKTIQKENPHLVANFHTPPVLSGVIDGWIGYGSNPLDRPNERRYSFNSLRAEVLKKSFDEATLDWLLKKINEGNFKIKSQDKVLDFKEYLALKITQNLLEKWKQNSFEFTQNNLSKNFPNIVWEIINDNLLECLNELFTGNPMNNIIIEVADNKNLKVTPEDIMDTIHKLAPKFQNWDKNYLIGVTNQIKNNSLKRGIDPDKFCFDSYVSKPLKKMIEEEQTEKITKYNISTIVDPSYLNKTIILPNGKMINGKSYLENYVYDMLPSNGFIITKDNQFINLKTFLEKGVFEECQTVYHGNLPRFFGEKTRNNIGFVTINYSSEIKTIPVEELFDYIDHKYYSMRFKDYNGQTIFLKEYLQKYFFPHVNPDGNIFLRDGSVISAIAYINNYLLTSNNIYTKLYETTRNNQGVININNSKIRENMDILLKQKDEYYYQKYGVR